MLNSVRQIQPPTLFSNIIYKVLNHFLPILQIIWQLHIVTFCCNLHISCSYFCGIEIYCLESHDFFINLNLWKKCLENLVLLLLLMLAYRYPLYNLVLWAIDLHGNKSLEPVVYTSGRSEARWTQTVGTRTFFFLLIILFCGLICTKSM